ncbi:hypothetical protein N9M50_03055 [Alphaproteobacteria bacterium]|nr:hypothetical protein [Alphaproteobacteria bacterium]
MKVIKAEYNTPDSDGDITLSMELALENSSEHEVEEVKSSCLLLGKSGVAVCGTFDNEDYIFIEPGETEDLTIWTPYLKER